jgi:RecA-family ATPase
MVALAMGRPFLGRPTQRCRVLFFSAEDPAPLVRLRLLRICRVMDVEPAELAENLRVIDATEIDAALYVEQRVAGLRQGKTTAVYEALAQYVEAERIDVLVLDNASDLFDGDEIVRQLVRGFVRSLVQLVRKRGGAVCLLAHVDKATSRAGKGASSESYSGSTAWHNSARSRVVLLDKGDGQLELQHQKCNLGPRQPTVLLTWPAGGLPHMAAPEEAAPTESRPDAATAMRRLVELVRDFNERGESVSTSMQSTASPAKLFAVDPRYPSHLRPAAVQDLLRAAERAKYLGRETYSGAHRKALERWRITTAGVAWVDNLSLFGNAATADEGAA